MGRQPFQVIVVWVTHCHQSLALVQALILGDFKGLGLNSDFHLLVLAEFSCNLIAASLRNFLLTAWAAEEGERYAQGAPLVLEELKHAVSMENMPTTQLNARLSAKLTRVADCAKFFCSLSFCLLAAAFEASKAGVFTSDAIAPMAAGVAQLVAALDNSVIVGIIAASSVDQAQLLPLRFFRFFDGVLRQADIDVNFDVISARVHLLLEGVQCDESFDRSSRRFRLNFD